MLGVGIFLEQVLERGDGSVVVLHAIKETADVVIFLFKLVVQVAKQLFGAVQAVALGILFDEAVQLFDGIVSIGLVELELR